MTVNPQRVQRLQEYGLTEYEARAYLALLELEKAEASQIADLSRVPRTKIYQALDGLEGKKLIKVVPERPKRYLVQTFSNYLDDLESGLRQKAADLVASKDALATEFAPRGNVQIENAGGFIVLKGRANIASKLVEMAGRATTDISVATSEMGARRLAYHGETLVERADAGATVRILAPLSRSNAEQMMPLAGSCGVRHAMVDLGSVTLAFTDDREVLFVHHVPDDHHYFQGSDVALWSDDPAIVASLKALYALAWSLGLEWTGGEAPRAAQGQAAVLAAVADEMRRTLAKAIPA